MILCSTEYRPFTVVSGEESACEWCLTMVPLLIHHSYARRVWWLSAVLWVVASVLSSLVDVD